jgi:hypothetical protein
MKKPEFKTLKSYSADFGTRNFIEIALKEAKEGDKANKFVSISKGYTDEEGRKHYKRSLGFSIDSEIIDFLIKKLPELKDEVEDVVEKAEEIVEEAKEKIQKKDEEADK